MNTSNETERYLSAYLVAYKRNEAMQKQFSLIYHVHAGSRELRSQEAINAAGFACEESRERVRELEAALLRSIRDDNETQKEGEPNE